MVFVTVIIIIIFFIVNNFLKKADEAVFEMLLSRRLIIFMCVSPLNWYLKVLYCFSYANIFSQVRIP